MTNSADICFFFAFENAAVTVALSVYLLTKLLTVTKATWDHLFLSNKILFIYVAV